MKTPQWIAIGITALLIVTTYFACPVKPEGSPDTLTKAPTEATGLESLIRAAQPSLTERQVAVISGLEGQLNAIKPEDDTTRLSLLEQLAGEWYRAGHPAISGVYAQKIADIRQSEEAWSIAGTTFSLCLQKQGSSENTRQFCASQAEAAYQSAISLAPDNVEHRINLALSYLDYPPDGNPMKGIMDLRELEKEYPDNPQVYATLGQLAIKTGQWDRAAQRLEKVMQLSPNDVDTACSLASVYEQMGKAELAQNMKELCLSLRSSPSN